MKKTMILSGLALAAGMSFSISASAQTPTCSNVVWDQDVLAGSPHIAEHCLEVVERNGAWYAKMRAKIVRHSASSTLVRYQKENGVWSTAERTYPPRGMTAEIDGQDVEISKLQPGQEVNVYVLDEDYFKVPSQVAAAPAAAPAAPAPAADPAPAPEPAPAMLPKTASQTNWLAVLGTLLILLGGVSAVFRSRN